MATPFHTTVDLNGFHFEDSKLTFVLNDAIVKADEGKPVTFDSANNRVKLAVDGSSILGVLEVVEDREIEGIKVGTIALRYTKKWPIKASDTLAVGDTAVGAGSGEVRKRTAAVAGSQSGTTPFAVVFPVPQEAVAAWGANLVVEVSSGYATVIKV